MVETKGIEINMPVFGYTENPEHTVVCIPGSGDSTFAPAMKNLSTYVRGYNCFVVMDRPGYGISDSTSKDITTDYIVELYREALKNAGYEAPYVLMPHSLGGMYAEYWVSKYPDEVEAMLMLDTVFPGDGVEGFSNDFSTKLFTFLDSAYYETGIARMCGEVGTSPLTNMLPEEYRDTSDKLCNYRPVNGAKYSELFLYDENMKKVEEITQETKCPKLYVCTDCNDIESYETALRFDLDASGVELTDEILSKRYEEYKSSDLTEDHIKKRREYLEKLGNCTIENVPASHFVYNEYPDIIAADLENIIALAGE